MLSHNFLILKNYLKFFVPPLRMVFKAAYTSSLQQSSAEIDPA